MSLSRVFHAMKVHQMANHLILAVVILALNHLIRGELQDVIRDTTGVRGANSYGGGAKEPTPTYVAGVAASSLGKYAGDLGCLKNEGKTTPINDDYCDCVDEDNCATDEPGTSACSGLRKGLFFCPNPGAQPKYLFSSRVRDGICDCCDGADEAPGFCSNTCESEGEEFRESRLKAQYTLDQAARLMEQQRQANEKKEKEHEEWMNVQKDMIANLEAQKLEVDALVTQTRAAYDTEIARVRDARELNEEKILDESTTTTTTTTTTSTSSSSEEQENVDGVISEYAKWMDKEAGLLDDAPVDIEEKKEEEEAEA